MASEQNTHSESPPLTYRWLHGGPELDDLTAIPLASTSNNTAPSVYRSFTDAENLRLEAAWNQLSSEEREKAWRTRSIKPGTASGKSSAPSSRRGSGVQGQRPEIDKKGKSPASANVDQTTSEPGKTGGPKTTSAVSQQEEEEAAAEERAAYGESYIADAEHEGQSHIVHVSQDNLFSADVRNWSLYPVFWRGSRIGIQRAIWFYSSTTLSKFYPVDPLLAHYLEQAYHEIKPYDSSYEDELRSAVEFGAEAEAKLKHNMPDVGVDVIFQGAHSARIYARNLPARLSKSFLTSFIRDKGHPGGGTLLYRGYDAVLKHCKPKETQSTSIADKAHARAKSEAEKIAHKASNGKTSAIDHHEPDSDKAQAQEEQKKQEETSKGTFGTLFSFGSRFGTSSKSRADAAEKGDSNTTAEALEDDKGEEDGKDPELAELVLVIHGIGQKLAATYDSFNIVHAINQLRKLCNKKGRDPAVAQLIGNKRVQFIPLQWRSSLQFDEMEKKEDADAAFDNVFTLDDVQVQGSIPFVRSLVTGVGMDLAFYLSHHREKMTATVVRDANSIHRLFCHRNPGFKGKVSIIAHSLGTALATDILSSQPTYVDRNPSTSMSDKHFEFDVSSLFFLGSPVAYMFFLNRGQLIPRKGRARTQDASNDVALDKAGRYGCMAIDNLYNIYNVVDPVACCLNACVDAEYAKIVKPQPVSSITSSLLADYTAKVSSFFGSIMSTFGSSSASGTQVVEKTDDKTDSVGETGQHEHDNKPGEADELRQKAAEALSPGGNSSEGLNKSQRPKTKRQATMEMDNSELARFKRAEARMMGLNPQGTIDFYLTAEGFSEYYAMLLSHASYWSDARFATFVLTQLFASSEAIRKGKEKLEEEEEKQAATTKE